MTLTYRIRGGLAAAGIATLLGGAGVSAVPLEAQPASEWRFRTDPFAELWYHGLAMIGFHGFGRVPLYDAAYAWSIVSERRSAGQEPTTLERDRGAFQAAFTRDPAFEVLHFVPLYLADAPVDVALDALDPLSVNSGGRADARIAREITALAGVISQPAQREMLARFVRALREERPLLADASRPELDVRASGLEELWSETASGPLADFLGREGLERGWIVVTPALGPEGRFLERPDGSVVAVGVSAESDRRAVVGAVVRELCYPAVRRALTPYESWFDDRATVSDVSDQAATRCGALLLEAHAPDLLPAYRSRFGDTTSDAAFLSAAGFPPGAAALESQLDEALRRELELNSGSGHAASGPAGR
ncbi:MAG: hypothetical protein AMS19_10840 [Gemmatimonas sp. SG8_23]|jgi:hypothetical protein|nr:MAG: hypothetical protein AMS19_10840 [Gemmatimonas sp. SG8_23]